jgi:hypothetical protein
MVVALSWRLDMNKVIGNFARPNTGQMLRQYAAPTPTFGKSGVSPSAVGGVGQGSAGKAKSLRQSLGANAGYNYDTLGGTR